MRWERERKRKERNEKGREREKHSILDEDGGDDDEWHAGQPGLPPLGKSSLLFLCLFFSAARVPFTCSQSAHSRQALGVQLAMLFRRQSDRKRAHLEMPCATVQLHSGPGGRKVNCVYTSSTEPRVNFEREERRECSIEFNLQFAIFSPLTLFNCSQYCIFTWLYSGQD